MTLQELFLDSEVSIKMFNW